MTITEFLILTILASGSRHGYALIAEIDRASTGRVTVSTATLYRMLERLQRQGLIETVESPSLDVRRHYYGATEAGTQAARDHLEILRDAVDFATSMY